MSLTLGLVAFTALLDSINPCAISVLLLTIGFLISLNKERLYIFKIGIVYILGIYLTYLAIGLGVLRALSFFLFPHVLAKIGSLFLVASALINLINVFFPKFPIKLKMPDSSHPILAKYIQRATLPAALILGILVGLFEFPCTGGPYLLILGLLHDQSTFLTGFAYLAFYNLIFVLPLVVILAVANNPVLLGQIDTWRKSNTQKADIIASLLLLLLAGVIFFTS
jgi:cytochrome c biogenesis protein CcdA